MLPQHYIYYEIRTRDVTINDYLKECEAEWIIDNLRYYFSDPIHFDYFDEADLEWKNSYSEIKELINSDDSLLAEEKITKIFIETNG